MKKFLIVLGLLAIIMPTAVLAGVCSDLGGNCFVSCNDSTAGSGPMLPSGNSGCADPSITGKNCCVVGSTVNTAGGSSQIIPSASGEGCTVGGESRSPSECGNYTVNDFLRLGVNISNWILGIVGSLVIAMFVYGGFKMVISRGEAKEINEGKAALTAAVIGLVIVLGSYVVVRFFMGTMGLDWKGSSGMPAVIIQSPSNNASSTAN